MKIISNLLNNIHIQDDKAAIKAVQAAAETLGTKIQKTVSSPADPAYFQAMQGVMTKKQDFAVQEFIKNSPLLQLYQDAVNSKYHSPFIEQIDILQDLDLDRATEIEKICRRIAQRLQQEGFSKTPKNLLKQLLDLSQLNPEGFEYAMHSDTLIERFFRQNFSSDSCTKNLTPISLKEIEIGIKTQLTKAYVESSDSFSKNPENVNALHRLLSEHKIEGPMLVKRAERETGIFDGIKLDDKALVAKIRLANKISQTKTRKATFSGYTRSYIKSAGNSDLTIYKHISEKKDLSLADAMLMMPYLDEKTRQSILDKINGTIILDDRFKSTTLSDGFVHQWLSGCSCRNSQARIINSITLQKGTEGRYIDVPEFKESLMTENQCEFLLNNTLKQITVTGATYDAENNIFLITSELKNL